MFDIPLMGEGTGSVEALPSYLHRCAYHHAVPTTKFLEYLHLEWNHIHMKSRKMVKASQTVKMQSILTYGKYTKIYVDIVRRLIGRDISSTTFLPFLHVITEPETELCRDVRWCPECFKAFRLIESEPYIKLIWHLSEVTHCPHHKTPLISQCAHCGKTQNAIGRIDPLDVCHHCKLSLSVRSEMLSVEDFEESWIYKAFDLLKLLTHIAHRKGNCLLEDGTVKVEGLQKSLRDFSRLCIEPAFEQAYEYCWTNRDVRKQIWGDQSVSLRTLRILAHMTNIEVFDLLEGRFLHRTRSLRCFWQQELPEQLVLNRKRKKHNHAANFERLSSLANVPKPLSLKEVARKAGVSIGYINYRFPILKQQIVERYKKYVDETSITKHHQATRLAFKYFHGAEHANDPKSRKQALKYLSERSGLTKLYLKPAISRAHWDYNKGVK